jgi:hypothetical protein
VYKSKHGNVRIVKVLDVDEGSKAWAADPSNRQCDATGSWYCLGAYPPLLTSLWPKGPTGGIEALEEVAEKAEKGGEEGLLAEADGSFLETVGEAVQYQMAYATRVMAQKDAGPAPNGPGLPPGSFQGSCKGCSMSEGPGSTLTCTHCRGGGRPYEPTSLLTSACTVEGGVVDNVVGELRCKPPPNDLNIPSGGYAQSCWGCMLTDGGALLKCTDCGRADGGRVPAAMHVSRCPPPGAIDNNNGVLQCKGLENQPGLPSGGFSDSCSGCTVTADELLTCTHCSSADGSQHDSSLDLSTCHSLSIDNHNGQLVCNN